MDITLQRQLNITMAKQNLYRHWVGSDADQKRCESVTQIVEAKSPWGIIDESAVILSVR